MAGTCGKDDNDLPLYESWTRAVACISVESGPKEGADGTVLSLPTCQTRPFGRHPRWRRCIYAKEGIWSDTRVKDPDFLILAVLNGSYKYISYIRKTWVDAYARINPTIDG